MSGIVVEEQTGVSLKPRFHSTNASVLLDGMRGIAALLVLIGHWRNLLFVDFPQIHQHRAAWGALYLVSSAGHQSVIIFFVLSGYLISGTVLRSMRGQQWSWKRYLTHRLVRLWLVLVPALILGFVWDEIGLHLGQAPLLYAGAGRNHLIVNVAHALSAPVFLGNLAFLQTILVPPLGSNGPLWSLSNEWWYYILFPLAASLLARAVRTLWSVVASIILLCVVAVGIGKAILLLFPVWLLGTLLYLAPKPKRGLSNAAVLCAALLYALAFFGFAALDHRGGHVAHYSIPGALADTLLGVVTFSFLWLLLSRSDECRDTPSVRLARETARFSYTLYVTHTPLLIFCTSLLVHDSRWSPTGQHLLLASLVLAATIGYAWLVASLTEFRTDVVRVWIESKILPRGRV